MPVSMIYSILTVVIVISFFGIVIWAYSPSQKERFHEAENLPFNDESNIGSEK